MKDNFKTTLNGLFKLCTITSGHEKGKALEDLIKHVFSQIPGLVYWDRDQLDMSKSQEIDLAFFNDAYKFLPEVLIVECKNWDNPVGSSEVGWFDSKVRMGGLDLGILVAANGITGDPLQLTSSHHTISVALAEKRRLLAFKMDDFRSLNNPSQVIELIKMKLCELRVRHTCLV